MMSKSDFNSIANAIALASPSSKMVNKCKRKGEWVGATIFNHEALTIGDVSTPNLDNSKSSSNTF